MKDNYYTPLIPIVGLIFLIIYLIEGSTYPIIIDDKQGEIAIYVIQLSTIILITILLL